mmetsp:Transcript_28040/g.40579  ORF Transcript_28040/g.40579 Transcript_28040/m.40579 type:complete len:141 (-) Transcript_28040:219-641(-)
MFFPSSLFLVCVCQTPCCIYTTFIRDNSADKDDTLQINVGGTTISASHGILSQQTGTVLAVLFSGCWKNELQCDSSGNAVQQQMLCSYTQGRKETPYNIGQIKMVKRQRQSICTISFSDLKLPCMDAMANAQLKRRVLCV